MKPKDKSKGETIDKEVPSTEEFSTEDASSGHKSGINRFKEFGFSAIHALGDILKFPFKMFARYLRDELIQSIKEDTKIYVLISGLMAVLFVFFSIIWFFISVAVGVYFYDNQYSILSSILYSIAFQILSFILVALIMYSASKKLKTLKLLKRLGDAID